MYAVGIDIGTTYTAAAVWRAGHAETAPLGSHSAAIPSVVFVRSDGSFLSGESASRRGLSEPSRVAREFKRRLGETTPILLGGAPYSPAALTGRMLRSVLDAVSAREGGPPASICVTHPANWGPYKIDLLRQVVALADIEQPVQFTTESQAAASYYAHQQRLEPGAVLAVYDLGGGTFDAAALRLTANGFDLIGEPEGIERLGGIDFDAAIFAHVAASVGSAMEQLDKSDPAVIAATARLRDECVQAKESLSADTDATIQVLLPTVTAEVRLTRSELEQMVRPRLQDSVEALRRAVRSAGYSPQVLSSVLLVGGSSRMPIVAQMVGSELGRPVAVDANPKHAVALGAAWLASGAIAGSGPAPSLPEPVDPWVQGAARPAPLVGTAADPIPDSEEPTGEIPVRAAAPKDEKPEPSVSTPATPVVPAAATPVVPAAATPVVPAAATPVVPAAATPAATAGEAIPVLPPLPKGTFSARVAIGSGQPAPPPAFPPAPPAKTANRRVPVLAAAAVVVLLLAAGGSAWVLARSGGRDDTAAPPGPGQRQSEAAAVASAAASNTPPAVPADELCTDAMKKSTRWVCLTKATLRNNVLTVEYDVEWNGTTPDIKTGFHLHMYGGDGAKPDESTMGSQAVKHSKYYFEDKQPSVRRTTDSDFQAIGNAKKVCARIAQTGHGLTKAYDGSYHTGNCIPIQRS